MINVLRYFFTVFVLGYTLLFPNAPVRLSLLSVVFFASVAFIVKDNKKQYPLAFIVFGFYALVMGLIYTQGGPDYEMGRAIKTPAVIGMLGVVTWVGLRPLKEAQFLLYGMAWNMVQFIGILFNIRGIDTHHLLPFAVTKGIDLQGFQDTSIADQLETQSRYFGFTAEGSIVAGVSALFAVCAINHVLGKWMKSDRPSSNSLLVAGLTVACACAISVLAKTKAGVAVMLCFGLVAWIGILFSRVSVTKKATASTSVVLTIVALLLGLIGYAAISHKAADYMQQEAERTAALLKSGEVSYDGAGTATRSEYAKLAVLGALHTPWGVGASNGYAYAKPVLKQIDPTPEMQMFFDQRVYNGYKSVLLNMLGMAGIVGMVCFFLLLNWVRRDVAQVAGENSYGLGWGVAAAFLALSFCADEIPIFPLIAFVGTWCAASREAIEQGLADEQAV